MKKYLFTLILASLVSLIFAGDEETLKMEWKKDSKFDLSVSEKVELSYGEGQDLVATLSMNANIEVIDSKKDEVSVNVRLASLKRSGEVEFDSEKLEGDAQKKMFSSIKEKGVTVSISKGEIKEIKNLEELSKEASAGDENTSAMLTYQYDTAIRAMLRWLLFTSSFEKRGETKKLSERIGTKWDASAKPFSAMISQEIEITYEATLKEVKEQKAILNLSPKSAKTEEVKEVKGSGTLEFDTAKKRPVKLSLEQSFKLEDGTEKQKITVELSDPKK
jgi:hypothetical protein